MSNQTQKTFNIKDVVDITINTPGMLFLEQSSTESLSIDAPESFFEEAEILNENNRLTIRLRASHVLQWLFRHAFNFQREQIIYRISVTELNRLSLGGDIVAEIGAIKSNALTITNSGSIKAHFDTLTIENDLAIKNSGSVKGQFEYLQAKSISLSVSGSADLSVSNIKTETLKTNASGSMKFSAQAGETTDQELHISGSGNYDTWKLRSNTSNIHISGSGKAMVWSESMLKVHVSGSGTIHYHGEANVEQHVSGAGNIKKLAFEEH